jgi:hypothetical protein
MDDQKYTGIFHNTTPGRNSFCIVDINKRFFLMGEKQIIGFNNENIQTHTKTYSVSIKNIFYYNEKELLLISYLYEVFVSGSRYTTTQAGVDIVIKDGHGVRYDFNVKEAKNINDNISFAKVINKTLFVAFSDNNEMIYTMDLDGEIYEVKKYYHQVGQIQNIWLKNKGDNEYIFTSEKDKVFISGVFKITGQASIEVAELYTYNITGYDTNTGSFLY